MVLDWFVLGIFLLLRRLLLLFSTRSSLNELLKDAGVLLGLEPKMVTFYYTQIITKLYIYLLLKKKISLGNLQNPSFAVKLGHTTAILRKVLPCFCPHVHCLGIHLQQILRFAPEESALWWAKSPFRFRSKMVARPRCISSQQNYLKFAEINQVKIKRY